VATEAMEELVAALGGKKTGNGSDQIPEVHHLLPTLPDGLKQDDASRHRDVQGI
jgi:hypothetical protein